MPRADIGCANWDASGGAGGAASGSASGSAPIHGGGAGGSDPRRDGRFLPLEDREELGALLQGLGPRLEAVALRITRHPEHARDVVQNAFEKVLRHGARFQGQSRVSTWMHRIVANEALMWLRSQRRRAEVPVPPEEELCIASPAQSPAEPLDRCEEARELYRGLERLSPEDRDLLVHCALADESYAAYGARHGLHPGAVKSRAFRARRQLGALLQARIR